MAFKYSPSHSCPSISSSSSSSSSDFPISNREEMSRLYDELAMDLDEHGPAFLEHGETSLSLSLSEIFTIKDGSVTPALRKCTRKAIVFQQIMVSNYMKWDISCNCCQSCCRGPLLIENLLG